MPGTWGLAVSPSRHHVNSNLSIPSDPPLVREHLQAWYIGVPWCLGHIPCESDRWYCYHSWSAGRHATSHMKFYSNSRSDLQRVRQSSRMSRKVTLFGSLGLRPRPKGSGILWGHMEVINSNYCSPSSATISLSPQWSAHFCVCISLHEYFCSFRNAFLYSNACANEYRIIGIGVLLALFTVWVFSIVFYPIVDNIILRRKFILSIKYDGVSHDHLPIHGTTASPLELGSLAEGWVVSTQTSAIETLAMEMSR